MINHMIINVSQITAQYVNQKQTMFEKPPNKAREKRNTLSLEAYDLYIFLPRIEYMHSSLTMLGDECMF